MIRMSVFYPRTEGASFDHDYFCTTHLPLVLGILQPDGAAIDRGVNGPYEAAAHFTFADFAALEAGTSHEHAGEMKADMVNYTTIVPTVQISEIVA